MKKILNQNASIPYVGLGTFLARGEEVYNAVLEALNAGYRMIDTASVYKNEEEVGRAIKDSGISREEIFITTKLWNGDQGYESTKKAIEESMRKLGVDYIDLYLIHWPKGYQKALESYKAMEEYYQNGKIKALGVSNFQIHHLEHLLPYVNVRPVINQVELHLLLQQYNLQLFCAEHGITLTSYGSLMKGHAFEIEELKQIAKKHGKSVVNVIVRWGIERDIIMIPKSVTKERIIDNFKVFDFTLDEEDHEILRKLNKARRFYSDPDNIDF